MHRFRPSRPRPWWAHVAFAVVVVIIGLVVWAGARAGGTPATSLVPDRTTLIAAAVVLAIPLLASVLVDPYAGALLLAIFALVATLGGRGADVLTLAVMIPVAVSGLVYYVLHVWVTRRVWELADGGRARVADDVRERRGLVLEIGRRFLVALLLFEALTFVGLFVPAFRDAAAPVVGSVRDAAGLVIVIDVLAVAPIRFVEARRVFDEHRARFRARSARVPTGVETSTDDVETMAPLSA